jgi:hypothetical protein
MDIQIRMFMISLLFIYIEKLWTYGESAVNIKCILRCFLQHKELSSVALGPRANYTDRATAASWRSLRIEGVAWSAQRIPKVVNLGFLDRSRYFSFK